jgi:S1-C subfamily serine protease
VATIIVLGLFGGGFGVRSLFKDSSTNVVNGVSQTSTPLVTIDPGQEPVAAVALTVSPSVVQIDTSQGLGSGVVYDASGLVMTNAHVVGTETSVVVRTADGKSHSGQVLGADTGTDIAVIRVSGLNVPVAALSQAKPMVGQMTVAVGSPFGLTQSVTSGIVSAVNRPVDNDKGVVVNMIQTDASINPGNSGGALCDAAGRLIGINSAIASGTGQSVGIGFAIPVDRVKTIVDQIVTVGHARYAGLGVRYNERLDGVLGDPNAREQLAQELGTSNLPSNGIIVLQTGGAAAKAGIGKYDIILAIDGEKIDGTFDMNRILVPKKPGDVVSVKFWSNGETKTVRVKLQELEETV